jgi:hypothetical protein
VIWASFVTDAPNRPAIARVVPGQDRDHGPEDRARKSIGPTARGRTAPGWRGRASSARAPRR